MARSTVARTLREEGCRHFGVATLEEARELRDAGLDERIYLLGGFFAEQAETIVALNLIPSIFDLSLIEPLDRAAERAGQDAAFRRPSEARHRRDPARYPAERNCRARSNCCARASRSQLEGACTLLANAADPAKPGDRSAARRFQRGASHSCAPPASICR